MERKLSSYQKLKLKYQKEVSDLYEDISVLIGHKESTHNHLMFVKLKYKVRISMEEAVWFGSTHAT